jgi:hypothetical protein
VSLAFWTQFGPNSNSSSPNYYSSLNPRVFFTQISNSFFALISNLFLSHYFILAQLFSNSNKICTSKFSNNIHFFAKYSPPISQFALFGGRPSQLAIFERIGWQQYFRLAAIFWMLDRLAHFPSYFLACLLAGLAPVGTALHARGLVSLPPPPPHAKTQSSTVAGPKPFHPIPSIFSLISLHIFHSFVHLSTFTCRLLASSSSTQISPQRSLPFHIFC